MGARGHGAGHGAWTRFRDEGMWFSCLILK